MKNANDQSDYRRIVLSIQIDDFLTRIVQSEFSMREQMQFSSTLLSLISYGLCVRIFGELQLQLRDR